MAMQYVGPHRCQNLADLELGSDTISSRAHQMRLLNLDAEYGLAGLARRGALPKLVHRLQP